MNPVEKTKSVAWMIKNDHSDFLLSCWCDETTKKKPWPQDETAKVSKNGISTDDFILVVPNPTLPPSGRSWFRVKKNIYIFDSLYVFVCLWYYFKIKRLRERTINVGKRVVDEGHRCVRTGTGGLHGRWTQDIATTWPSRQIVSKRSGRILTI